AAPRQAGAAAPAGGRRNAGRHAAGAGLMVRARNDECRGDLLARGQRGGLATAEQGALRAHLSSWPSCQLLQRGAAAFVGVAAVQRGDEAGREQMSAAARRAVAGGGEWRMLRTRRRAVMRVASAAAGLILLAGTASAAAWLLPLLVRKASPDKPVAPSASRA